MIESASLEWELVAEKLWVIAGVNLPASVKTPRTPYPHPQWMPFREESYVSEVRMEAPARTRRGLLVFSSALDRWNFGVAMEFIWRFRAEHPIG